MPAPAAILDLVARFGEHIDAYKSGTYNETQLRRDYLDPLFKELGWDIDNTAGYAEAYRDVIHEDQVKVGGAVKAPDYGFRIGGQRKFFLEAKKPSVRIKDDVSPAYQLRRYAWSAKLPLSILSDFEEFAIYDTRIKPKPNDPASKARIFYCRFDEYPQHWDHIAGIFSIEAIRKGSFDKYAAAAKGKRGTAEVDADFLATIEGWRADLARNLALRNPDLTQRQLNFAVQRVLDRLIFLRICEDRGIEDYERLKKASESKGIYSQLVKLFQQADDRYNSGLFHFRAEKGRQEDHDTLTPHLVIDDALLKPLIRGLYYPESPYEFSVFTADILGQVYEQFLGKVITLSASHKATVEDKPEVKKAGGVFYTPTYIVDYIVRQTVDPLIEGKTPKQIEKVHVLDPACGSGSFLIGAYQFLLDWYHRYYTTHDPETHAKGKNPKLVAASGGGWKLTTPERKRILLAHIYGVDIDSQAVEVTKLSLLLKVLEGETAQTVQRELIHERVLPDLGDNIKCGNSLIGSDFYDQQGRPEMDTEAHLRINVFDWDGKDGFPEIMKDGGFDAVIGNPPYVDVKELPIEIKSELTRRYASATKRFDLYVPFIEKSLSILGKGGKLGFIVPSMFMRREYGQALRSTVLKMSGISEIVDFGTNQVFTGPQNYVAILILQRATAPRKIVITRYDRTGLDATEIAFELNAASPNPGVVRFALASSALGGDSEWQLFDKAQAGLSSRCFENFPPFREMIAFASEGIHSGKDEVFFIPKDQVSERRLESPPVYPLAKGKDIHRYESADTKTFSNTVVYPYDLRTGNVMSPKQLESDAPEVWRHLVDSRSLLRGRSYFDKSSKAWYELWCQRDPSLYVLPKIVGPEIANKGEFTISSQPLFINNKLKAIVLKSDVNEALHFVLGILNSRLVTYLHRHIAPPKGNNYFEVKTRILERLPIRRIDPKNKSDRAAHDRIVALVEKMLSLHRQRAAAKTPHEQTALDRQISATDASIDREVYALYRLTEDEIAIVEGRAVIEDKPAIIRFPKSTDDDGSTTESYGAAAHHHSMILREDSTGFKTKPTPKP